MLVGICKIELFISESSSLKAKRAVLKSLKTRIRNKFNVSISEVENNEKWQRATIGLAMVTNERKIIDSVFNKILSFIEFDGRSQITDHYVDIY